MNQEAADYAEILQVIALRIKDEAGLAEFNNIIKKRTEWLENYSGEDRTEIVEYFISTDEQLFNLIKEKADVLKKKILEEDEQDKNIGAYRLYE